MIVAATLVVVLLIARIAFVFRQIGQNRSNPKCQLPPSSKESAAVSTLIVLGSGGHTTELLLMTKHLDKKHYFPIHYCKASTDSTSADRLRAMHHHHKHDTNIVVTIHDIPRSREVGQSYFTSIFSTLHALIVSLVLIARLRPRLILCNGPGTCLPIVAAALVVRVLGSWTQDRTAAVVVFCESYCRVESLSLTGTLLYRLADVFLVHWKELHETHPRSILTSTFIQDDATTS